MQYWLPHAKALGLLLLSCLLCVYDMCDMYDVCDGNVLLFCRVIQTNGDDTFKMVLQNSQEEVPLTKPFPFVTTFVGKGDDYG